MPSELSGVMRRHRCYSQLLTICLAVMVTFALPKGLNWIGLVGYNLLPLVIIRACWWCVHPRVGWTLAL